MSAAAKSAAAFGFLTVVEHADFGLFGGYLILNAVGRPLEFHCTAPVKANRAQEILYGAVLRPYLYEQISAALLAKAKEAPLLICTDYEPLLAAPGASLAPVVLVLARFDEECGIACEATRFRLGENFVALSRGRADEQAAIEQRWRGAHAEPLDLLEPFVRIREALQEAQKSARPAA